MEKLSNNCITTHDLESLIQRCLYEAQEARLVRKNADGALVIEDIIKLSKHISSTVIGELYELEIIRKLYPIFRMTKELSDDFELLGDASKRAERRASIQLQNPSQKDTFKEAVEEKKTP